MILGALFGTVINSEHAKNKRVGRLPATVVDSIPKVPRVARSRTDPAFPRKYRRGGHAVLVVRYVASVTFCVSPLVRLLWGH
jgi:hypothetical protein